MGTYPYLVVVVTATGNPYPNSPLRRVDAADRDDALTQAFPAGPPTGKDAHTALVWRLAEPVELSQVAIEFHAPTWGTPQLHLQGSSDARRDGT